MSRHYVLVLFPDGLSEEQASEFLFDLLGPLDGEFDGFDPYNAPCPCTIDDAYEAYEAAEREVGEFYELWLNYRAMPQKDHFPWRLYIHDFEEAYLNAARKSAGYRLPDPACQWCHGSGVVKTTRAHAGRFDYWLFADGEGEVEFRSPDVWRVRDLPRKMADIDCGAIVTPDGRWHEAAGGMWDSENQAWQEEARVLLSRYPKCRAVRCLMHI